MKNIPQSPITHSEVLWHFTGGPKWNTKNQLQNKKLKTKKTSFEILFQILKTKKLKLGNYRELIKIHRPFLKKFSLKKKKLISLNYSNFILETSAVCCLADIPLGGLHHHSKRYGKFAIGFKRSSVLKAGFNPVFYTLDSQAIAKSYLSAHKSLNTFDYSGIEGAIEAIKDEVQNEYQSKLDTIRSDLEHGSEFGLCPHCSEDLNLGFSSPIDDVDQEIEIDDSEILDSFRQVDELFQNGLRELKHLMSFVKTFSEIEFNSIYAEREWRSLNPFNFKWSDVDSIIVPEEDYDSFDLRIRQKLGIPKRIKVISWQSIK